jgi:S-adenosylmethionine hydrolase
MRCVSLPIPAAAAPTFHGRDVFAPAAAELAQGIALDALGEALLEPVLRRTPEATRRGDGAVGGVVITIDRFGNAVTNLMARRGGVLIVGGRRLALARAYADAAPGVPVALVGSSGLVEIALREGNAAAQLGLRRGSEVVLEPPA